MGSDVYKRQIYIYACQDCVTHHPALQDAIELLESPHHRSRMTLHIYKVNAKGAVAEDRGKVEIVTGYPTEPAPHISAYHPAPARDAADAIAKH